MLQTTMTMTAARLISQCESARLRLRAHASYSLQVINYSATTDGHYATTEYRRENGQLSATTDAPRRQHRTYQRSHNPVPALPLHRLSDPLTTTITQT